MTRRFASIPVASVRVPKETLRTLDRAWATALGAMMATSGQAEPIEVAAEGKNYVLVFGLHRLEGRRIAGEKVIDALIDDEGGNIDDRRRRAVQENLFRRELSWLDRAIHIAELYEIEQQADPARRRGGDRSKLQPSQFGLATEIADKIGLSERTVYEATSTARRLSRRVRQRIMSAEPLEWLANSRTELLALATGPDRAGDALVGEALEKWQLATLDKIDAGKAGSITEVLAGKVNEPEAERHTRLALNAFLRLPPRNQHRFFDDVETAVRDWAQKRGWKP